MTPLELVRMICYVILAPSMLYLAIWAARLHINAAATFCAALSGLFVWYMVEITITATGVNTREYRVIGTPMVVALAISAVWMVAGAVRTRRVPRQKGGGDA